MEGIFDVGNPPLPDNVVERTGPRLLGYLLHWGLFGALCVQVYLFYIAFPNDPLRNKGLVYTIFLLEIVQTLIITQSSFNVFGYGYGNLESFNRVGTAWLSVPLVTGLVAFIAQLFYSYRIRVLAQSYWVASLIALLAITQLIGAIASAVVLKNSAFYSRLLGKNFSIVTGVWNGGSAACDIIIAIAMTYYLYRRRSGAMPNTKLLLRRVIRLVIETGTITAIMATLNLILTTLPHQPSYYLVTSETLAKFYSNSMLVVFNSRIRIRPGPSSSNEGSTSVSIGRLRNGVLGNNGGNGGVVAHRVGGGNGAESYELGEGVLITREEVIFPSVPQSKECTASDRGSSMV